jgi:tetratricopeptide (TPR) repeat protein
LTGNRLLTGIAAAAFAVKLVVLIQLWDHPLLQPHGELDTAYYVTLANRVAAEGVFAPIGAFFVSPLYVYFLAAVVAAGGSLLAAQLIQIAFGALGVTVLFATARHWFGERAALAGAALAILTGIFTFNEILILQSALDPFLVSCALYFLTRTASGGGPAAFAGAGASVALLALNRPNALVFAVAAAAIVVAGEWRHGRVTRGAALVTALIAVLGANAARNYAVSGAFVLIASHGGLNFYIGNHDRADGTYTPVPGITPSIAGQAGDSARVAEAETGRRLSPGEVSNYFARRAFDWIIEHPAAALRLWIRKIGILLNRVDVPLNHSYAFYAREPFSFLRLLAVGPWLLLPVGLVGLLWPALRANTRGYWVWAMFVPVYGAAVVLFFVTDRYRLPLFVPLCATAGAALIRLFDLVRALRPRSGPARQAGALVRPAGAIALVAVVAFLNLGLTNGIGGEQTRQAVLLVEQGAFDEARRYLDEISPHHDHPGVLRFRVAQALLDANRPADAAPLLSEAIEIDGARPALRLALGEALFKSGRVGEALKQLSGIEDQVPGTSVASALDFGTLALEHGAIHEATRWLQIAVRLAPGSAEAHEKLGVAFFLAGDGPTARPYLERACQLDPGSASAHLNLAAVYAELRMFSAAREQARLALSLDPSEARAAALLNAVPK